MPKKILFAGLWMLLAGVLPGQDASAYFHHLTVEDGLSQGTNHFIYKDSTGFIWLSSLNGLNRYDGRRVKVYKPVADDSTSLFGQNIQSSFFETKEHNLWVTTFEGLNCYVRKHDNFRHFILKNDEGKQLFGYYIFHLDENDNLWVIVDGIKLYHFHIPTGEFIFQHDLQLSPTIRATAITDQSGAVVRVIYQGYQILGLSIVDYKNGVKTGSELKFGEDDVTPLLVKKIIREQDALWMATNRGLAHYDPGSDKVKFYNSSGGSNDEICNSIASLDDERLLTIIDGRGLMVFNKKERRFTAHYSASPTDPHSITSNEAGQVFVDADGAVWLSFDNQGVDFYHPLKQKFQTLKPKSTSLNNATNFAVKTLVEDSEGNVWCGTAANGIAIYKEKARAFEWKTKTDGPVGSRPLRNIIKMFTDSKERIWILSWEGISVWLPAEKQLLALPGIKDVFLDGCELQNGKIVLAAFTGNLYEIKESPGNKFSIAEIPQMIDISPFTSVWQDSRGRLFGCKLLKEIWVTEPGNDFRLIQKIPLEGESSSFCERPGDPSVWVGNSYGLARLIWNNGKYDYTIFTEKDGLPSSVVSSVIPDSDGMMWLGTSNGVSRFDPKKVHFQNFGMVDGISALQFNAFARLNRKNGQIWLGSVNGITSFLPEKVNLLNVQAYPVITQILINDQEYPSLFCDETGATNVSEIKRLSLDYQRSTISFSFAALEYSHPESTQFKYKLEGVDPDWVSAGNENFARYAKIPPGLYTFSIKASNSDGIWSGSQSIVIYIEPPFTQTPLFYTLIGALILSFIWAFVQYRWNRSLRLRQQEEDKRKALESERQRIARDVHDDLGSGLSALSLLTEIARYKNTKEELKTELEKINAASRELSGKVREVIWTVNASNDTISSLISYLNNYALELLDNAEIDYHVSLPDPIPDTIISGEYRRTLFLAFKETLNNILKHARATKVVVDFFADPGNLRISVKDNGIGFDPKLLLDSTGNGLRNLQSRMRDINGDCKFETGPSGTQVVYTLNMGEK